MPSEKATLSALEKENLRDTLIVFKETVEETNSNISSRNYRNPDYKKIKKMIRNTQNH